VLRWVKDSAERARVALRVERDSSQPRKTLVAELESIIK